MKNSIILICSGLFALVCAFFTGMLDTLAILSGLYLAAGFICDTIEKGQK